MTTYLASIKPPGERAFHLAEFDPTGTVLRRWRPPAGRSWHRPVPGPGGRLLGWETAEGGSHDVPQGDARLVIDGQPVAKPAAWDLWGHPEWTSSGGISVAGRRGGVWGSADSDDGGQTWGWFTAGFTEPSWTTDGRIVGIVNKRMVMSSARSWPAPKGVDQLYDPFVSPDCRRLIALGRVGGLWGIIGARWGLYLLDLEAGTWRTIVKPSWGENISAARWVDNATVVASWLRRDDNLRWDAWRFTVDTGAKARIVAPGPARDTLGTIEYVAPSAWVAS